MAHEPNLSSPPMKNVSADTDDHGAHSHQPSGEPLLQTTIALLDKLIAVNTVSHRSNLEIIALIEDLLTGHGIASERVPNEAGDKAGLIALIEGRAPDRAAQHARGGAIVLSAHTDVVPVEGQNWSTDPFKLHAADGKLFGRGTADMKGFVACTLAIAPALAARQLSRPVLLAYSYDEEVGCLGVRPLVERLQSDPERYGHPSVAIVGEPSTMRAVTAHKGASRFQTVVTGLEAHSSRSPDGVNAVEYAAAFITILRAMERDWRARVPAPDFAPPYTTFHVGRISGGEALNIVPRRCTVDWEIRPVPGVATSDVLADLAERVAPLIDQMHAVAPDTGIATAVTNVINVFNGDGSNGRAGRLTTRMTGANIADSTVAYMTEAPFFQAAGISSIICGPGDIAQAHAPDEFIEVAELERCLAALERLAEAL